MCSIKEYRKGTCIDIFQWKSDIEEFCQFRLNVGAVGKHQNNDGDNNGQLLLFDTKQKVEEVYDTITLTDELKALHGQIIECGRVDNKWIFKRARNDRGRPNAIQTVADKLKSTIILCANKNK